MKVIISKMTVIATVEFELAYCDVAVLHFSLYVTDSRLLSVLLEVHDCEVVITEGKRQSS